MGIVFTFIYEKMENIYAPMIIHVAANLMAVFTSVSPIALWLEKHGFIKFIIAAIETIIFVQLVVRLYKKLDKKKEVGKQENHKIDFHI